MSPEEQLLREIASLVAKRDHSRDPSHKQNLLDCIALKLSAAGFSDAVDAF